jgi:myo-inositol-1(or 4)-monophosphatase
MPPYAVSIGLQVGTEIVVGVVYELGRDELFTAVRGAGAFRNGVPIRVSRRSALREALLTTGFPFREYGQIDAYLATLRRFMLDSQGVRRPGSAAADLANVACGRLEGFFELGLSAWDAAAGSLLIEEAGGKVTDFSGGDTWLFGRQIVASNGLLHDAMLERVDALRRSASLSRHP